MAETKQVLIPDIGDFQDVPVIEVLVKSGDSVKAEDPLIVLGVGQGNNRGAISFCGRIGGSICKGWVIRSQKVRSFW